MHTRIPRASGYHRLGFWLDGHNSDNNTAVDIGDAPVAHYLDGIFAESDAFEKVTILIDDARYMAEIVEPDPTYPPLRGIVKRLYANGFNVYIEHNVVIAQRGR